MTPPFSSTFLAYLMSPLTCVSASKIVCKKDNTFYSHRADHRPNRNTQKRRFTLRSAVYSLGDRSNSIGRATSNIHIAQAALAERPPTISASLVHEHASKRPPLQRYYGPRKPQDDLRKGFRIAYLIQRIRHMHQNPDPQALRLTGDEFELWISKCILRP